MRTSSRLGYLDLGVNAKRYQWFAERLGKETGWKTTPLTKKGHEQYFSLNQLSESDLSNTSGAAIVKTEKVKLESTTGARVVRS